jgi:glycosyltransferase involved in cell wall biosynthesis
MTTDFKIRIFQPIVPEYRVALFDGLAERYGNRVEVWAAERLGQDMSCPLARMRYDYNHPMKRIGPFAWQVGLALRGLGQGDVVVVCGDVRQLSSLWIALKAKCLGIAVVWWGHHWTATSRKLAVKLRLSVAKALSSVFLVYTRTGIGYLVRHGFRRDRVFATGNTIDQEPIKAARSAWSPERVARFQREQGIDGKNVLLCCSALRPKVRLDLAIKALNSEALADVVLAVIGEGSEKVAYRNLSEELNVADRIRWIGATRDQMVMAPWFLSAKAFVYPGSIGLSILHSFSYGLPVVTHGNEKHQMPEFEVMEDGKTGLCFEEGNVADLERKVSQLLSDEPKRLEMSEWCQKLALEDYSMLRMVANYCDALEAAHGL